MGAKVFRKYKKRIIAKVKRMRIVPLACIVLLLAFILMINHQKQLSVVPVSYRPLLELIARVESNGNYNAYFGNARNSSVDFTKMTVAEVQQWQKDYVAKGSPSSAVGRYQIIDTTLAELVRELRVRPDQLFDKSTQDSMAMALLERRGSIGYVNDKMSKQEFAANLAKEWASLPSTIGNNPEASFYDGDGLNRSLVSTDEVLDAIDALEPEEIK